MLTPFRLGVGGPLGNGRQWMPWIHVDDLAAMFLHAAEHTEVSGPINGVSPNPVTNKEFTKALAAAVHRPAFLPTPYFALRVVLGEFAKILFDSQRVVPRRRWPPDFNFAIRKLGRRWKPFSPDSQWSRPRVLSQSARRSFQVESTGSLDAKPTPCWPF